MRLAALSVDLDEIPNYFAIHGLTAPDGPEAHAVYDVALGRLDDFARAQNLPLTLFAIGRDLEREQSAAALRAMAERGHEMANHSLDHLYALSRRPRGDQRDQVAAGADAIERATGQRPTGFRAPGYTMTDALFASLAELGVAYESSVFPCPAYWAAKATAMASIRARGRRSRSILDTPAMLSAPADPYRVGTPYWRRGAGVLELPIGVTRGPRLPFIGTSVTLAGPSRARWLARAMVGRPLVNLELHGIDVLDGGDGLEALKPHQPDVRVPLARKLGALSAVVETLREAGYAFVRLDEAARAFASPS